MHLTKKKISGSDEFWDFLMMDGPYGNIPGLSAEREIVLEREVEAERGAVSFVEPGGQ